MITRINRKYMIIVVLLGLLSCKKEVSDSDVTFTQKCDFPGSEVEFANRLSGTLSYTNNIMDLPPANLPPNAEYVFLIRSAGRLRMVVCNMPAGFEMEEGESKNVTFSGRVVVYGDNVDAMSTWVELKYLKLE